MAFFEYILILLSCSVVSIVLCRRLHLPPILGYLSVGLLVGPGGLRLLPTIEEMHGLAEFGIVFLMFTLGLEFSIPRLIAAKKTLFGIGSTQVLICTLVAMIAGAWLKLNLIQNIIVGGAFALSSTAVVIKQLTEQKEQHLEHGSMSINILLFQDIAAVMFLIFIPAVAGSASNALETFFFTILKGIFICVSMPLIGLWILRPLFHEVAKAHSTELFMMATLMVALSAAGVTHFLGLSMALGAFLAGLMLGETEFKHQIELDIRPFRDVLLGLFFVVIGAYLEVSTLPSIWQEVLTLLLGLIFIKAILIFIIVKLFSSVSTLSSIRTGIILAHGGEFSFIILSEAINNNLIPVEQRPVLFATIVFSVMMSPLFIRYHKQICSIFMKTEKKPMTLKYPSHKLSEHTAELKNHVILCGFGRAGQILARFLDEEKIPWIALDLDPVRLSKASVAGEHSFYGDATHPNILAAAGLSRARMVVTTFGNEATTFEVLKHVRTMRLDVPVFVRTKDDSNLRKLQDLGATEVVPESLEGSIMLASHLLLTLGVPTSKIIARVRNIHTDRYEILRGIYRGNDDASMLEDHGESRRSLHSIFVTDNAFIIDKPISYVVKDTDTFTIRAITRATQRYPNPSKDWVIKPEDVIVVFATPEESLLLEEKILNG